MSQLARSLTVTGTAAVTADLCDTGVLFCPRTSVHVEWPSIQEDQRLNPLVHQLHCNNTLMLRFQVCEVHLTWVNGRGWGTLHSGI